MKDDERFEKAYRGIADYLDGKVILLLTSDLKVAMSRLAALTADLAARGETIVRLEGELLSETKRADALGEQIDDAMIALRPFIKTGADVPTDFLPRLKRTLAAQDEEIKRLRVRLAEKSIAQVLRLEGELEKLQLALAAYIDGYDPEQEDNPKWKESLDAAMLLIDTAQKYQDERDTLRAQVIELKKKLADEAALTNEDYSAVELENQRLEKQLIEERWQKDRAEFAIEHPMAVSRDDSPLFCLKCHGGEPDHRWNDPRHAYTPDDWRRDAIAELKAEGKL
jgi:hypothetical protein